MIPTRKLAETAANALEILRAQDDLVEGEVFVAANTSLVSRVHFTSHIPCNGVEEPKSLESVGLGIQAVFRGADGPCIGFGSEPNDLSPEGIRRALAKARQAAVVDAEFVSLPRQTNERRRLRRYHDPALLRLSDDDLVEAGWKVVRRGLEVFSRSPELARLAGSGDAISRLGLILSGDVTILHERIAIASTHLSEVQTDESTLILSGLTAMVETADAKGSGWSTGTRLADFTGEAGAEAAENAIRAIGGERVPSGHYRVIFGRQPVADLLTNLVLPCLSLGSFYAETSVFQGRLGRRVASPLLSIYDHGALRGATASKGITCEGLPTGKTRLIQRGWLVGLLTNFYEQQRILKDPRAAAKLGRDPREVPKALVARNGFRFGEGGGRRFEGPPGISPTNIVLESRQPVSREELLAQVREGLYIGRIWYTYPINGLRAGDFTCTVVGDSFLVKDGRLASPLPANAIRINDNIRRVLRAILGVSADRRETTVWAADEVIHAPEIAVEGIRVDAIAEPPSGKVR
ncbi:MAG TPA: metallopeptidase TldD-related protein [archaeon]|nr:metallopeptidase TldD-related protein [archaeon]